MKKRLCFVSNSSSSSFCILGVTSKEIEKQVDLIKKTTNKVYADEDDEDFDWYDFETKELTVHYGIDNYYDLYCLGISPSKMDENLTVAQNMQNVAELINKTFGTTFTKENIGFMTDGGHD